MARQTQGAVASQRRLKVRAAGMVADPLGLLDSSTVAMGRQVLVASAGLARELGAPLIRIAGSAVATDTLALHQRPIRSGWARRPVGGVRWARA